MLVDPKSDYVKAMVATRSTARRTTCSSARGAATLARRPATSRSPPARRSRSAARASRAPSASRPARCSARTRPTRRTARSCSSASTRPGLSDLLTDTTLTNSEYNTAISCRRAHQGRQALRLHRHLQRAIPEGVDDALRVRVGEVGHHARHRRRHRLEGRRGPGQGLQRARVRKDESRRGAPRKRRSSKSPATTRDRSVTATVTTFSEYDMATQNASLSANRALIPQTLNKGNAQDGELRIFRSSTTTRSRSRWRSRTSSRGAYLPKGAVVCMAISPTPRAPPRARSTSATCRARALPGGDRDQRGGQHADLAAGEHRPRPLGVVTKSPRRHLALTPTTRRSAPWSPVRARRPRSASCWCSSTSPTTELDVGGRSPSAVV
jgi:hypothetical protein